MYIETNLDNNLLKFTQDFEGTVTMCKINDLYKPRILENT